MVWIFRGMASLTNKNTFNALTNTVAGYCIFQKYTLFVTLQHSVIAHLVTFLIRYVWVVVEICVVFLFKCLSIHTSVCVCFLLLHLPTWLSTMCLQAELHIFYACTCIFEVKHWQLFSGGVGGYRDRVWSLFILILTGKSEGRLSVGTKCLSWKMPILSHILVKKKAWAFPI